MTDQPRCIYCEREDIQAPLIAFTYKGEQKWICAQHLPILIHKPAELADKLSGLERINPPESHPH